MGPFYLRDSLKSVFQFAPSVPVTRTLPKDNLILRVECTGVKGNINAVLYPDETFVMKFLSEWINYEHG
jgi:hypothetical protein